jgi:hypothetical protein
MNDKPVLPSGGTGLSRFPLDSAIAAATNQITIQQSQGDIQMHPSLPRDYAHWRNLRTLVDIIVDAYEVASDEIVNKHFDGSPEAFTDALNGELSDMSLPPQDSMRELLSLIAGTSTSDYSLGYEDRDFLTRVRSHLCDALIACLEGDIERLADHTNEAYKALDFMTYKRKRTDKRDYHNPFANERRRFEVLTARASRLARAFDKVAVSA